MVLCNCSLFGSALLCVNSSFAIILIGKRELAALLSLSSWCIVIVVWIFLAVPLVLSAVSGISCHTHLLFLSTVIGLTTKHAVCRITLLL